MIRANFNVDPYLLSDDQWADLFAQAVWIEGERLRNLTKILVEIVSKLFGDSDNG